VTGDGGGEPRDGGVVQAGDVRCGLRGHVMGSFGGE
jgi:hypothetical protein